MSAKNSVPGSRDRRNGAQLGRGAPEAAEHGRLADSVARLARADFRRFGIEPDEIRRALLHEDWLVGYVAGACLIRLEKAGESTRQLINLAGRVVGELLGGGVENRSAATQRLRQSMGTREFMLGSASAQRSWSGSRPTSVPAEPAKTV